MKRRFKKVKVKISGRRDRGGIGIIGVIEQGRGCVKKLFAQVASSLFLFQTH